jgi:hypothetical protein
MKSWQIYNTARTLMKSQLLAVYGNRNSRIIDYWAQDPAFSADHKRNPIDRMEALLGKLCECGRREVAISAVRILANQTNCTVQDREEVIPDKDSLLEEILDDMPYLINYQKALQGDDLEEVDRAKEELDREMAENRIRFIEKNKLLGLK